MSGAAMDVPEAALIWEVYALRYATRQGRAGEFFYDGGPDDEAVRLDYYVWLLKSGDRAILVDAGFTPETALARGRDLAEPVPSLLSKLGVELADVQDTIVTHLHYDHTGHVGGLVRSRIWLQSEEIRFWTGPFAHRPGYTGLINPADVLAVVEANFAGRVRHVAGDVHVAPGVSVHFTGGHSPGMQIVRVATERGAVVIASDASHLYANLEQDRPAWIVHSLQDMYGAFTRIRDLAGISGLWIPGHDPKVMNRFPAARTDLDGLAVRIA